MFYIKRIQYILEVEFLFSTLSNVRTNSYKRSISYYLYLVSPCLHGQVSLYIIVHHTYVIILLSAWAFCLNSSLSCVFCIIEWLPFSIGRNENLGPPEVGNSSSIKSPRHGTISLAVPLTSLAMGVVIRPSSYFCFYLRIVCPALSLTSFRCNIILCRI